MAMLAGDPSRVSPVLRRGLWLLALVMAITGSDLQAWAQTGNLQITRAAWRADDRDFRVEGRGAGRRVIVAISNEVSGQLLGSVRAENDGRWQFRTRNLTVPPCRVRVTAGTQTATREVTGAPVTCDGGQAPGTLQFSAAAVTVAEGTGSVSVLVNRVGGGAGSVSATVTIGGGTATAGQDYEGGPVQVVFADGDVAPRPVVVTILNDAAPEGDETILLTLQNPQGGAVLGVPAIATVTIRGDAPVLQTSHFGRFSTYEGSKTCAPCHAAQVTEVHASLHYQWRGPTPYVTTSGGQPRGKMGGINDFCGHPDINFIGQLINIDQVTVDGGCAQCHVGLGLKPSPTATPVQLENIDCLACHGDSYRRKVERRTDGTFRFVPASEKMAVPLLQAITDIRATPTVRTCVQCHAYAGGGCNNKRGDIELTHSNPPRTFDVHMASTQVDGAGLNCVSCHVFQNHKVAGARGRSAADRAGREGGVQQLSHDRAAWKRATEPAHGAGGLHRLPHPGLRPDHLHGHEPGLQRARRHQRDESAVRGPHRSAGQRDPGIPVLERFLALLQFRGCGGSTRRSAAAHGRPRGACLGGLEPRSTPSSITPRCWRGMWRPR